MLAFLTDQGVALAGLGNLREARLLVLLDLTDGEVSQAQVGGGHLGMVGKLLDEPLKKTDGVGVVVLGPLVGDGQAEKSILLVGLVRVEAGFRALGPLVVDPSLAGADGTPSPNLVGNFPDRAVSPHEEPFSVGVHGLIVMQLPGGHVDSIGVGYDHWLGLGVERFLSSGLLLRFGFLGGGRFFGRSFAPTAGTQKEEGPKGENGRKDSIRIHYPRVERLPHPARFHRLGRDPPTKDLPR